MSFLSGITSAIGDVVNPIMGIVNAGVSAFSGMQAANAQKETNQQNLQIARETNAFNAAQAEAERAWATRFAETAYQRTRTDMLQAGFNPMLAMMKGPTGAPTGASASGISATFQNPTAVGIGAAAQAANVANQLADVDLKKSSADLNRAQIPRVQAETGLTLQQQKKVIAEVEVLDRAKFTEEWRAALMRWKSELAQFQADKMNPVELEELKYKVQLIEYSLEGAKNTAEGQKKWEWYMQNIAPILPDLLKSSSAASAAQAAMRPRPRALIFGR